MTPFLAQCDFCGAYSDPLLLLRYPCRSFVMETITIEGQGTQEHCSETDWAACGYCAPLIDDGEYVSLADRSMKKHRGQPALLRALLFAQIRALHDQFRAHQNGPPRITTESELPEIQQGVADSKEAQNMSLQWLQRGIERLGDE